MKKQHALLPLALLIQLSCNLFTTREAKPPDTTGVNCSIETISTDYVILNLECSLTNRVLLDYINNLDSTFTFIYDSLADLTYLKSNNYTQEQDIIEKLMLSADTMNFNLDLKSIETRDALTEISLWHYLGELKVKDTIYALNGNAQLKFHLQNDRWYLVTWMDFQSSESESTKAVTLGWIKDKYYLNQLPR
jgi:hypothetical protein